MIDTSKVYVEDTTLKIKKLPYVSVTDSTLKIGSTCLEEKK